MPTAEELYRIFKEEKERLQSMSAEELYDSFKQARTEALPEEIPMFRKQPEQPTQLGAAPHVLGFEPSYNLLPEPANIFQDPDQPTRASFKAKEADLAEAAPETPEFRKLTGLPFFRITSEYANQLHTAKEARLIREKYDPGDRFAAFIEGILPTPPGYKPVGFDQAFPLQKLGGKLTRILLFNKAAAIKGVATGTADIVHQAAPFLTGKAATVPIISQIMNHDLPATLASKLLYNEWFPSIVGNAVERGLVWGADAFIDELGKTLDPQRATKKGLAGMGFGGALGAVHVMPFGGISSPSEAGKIGMSRLLGQATIENVPKTLEIGANVLPVVLAGGIGGARAALNDYWEQGNKLKPSALKEAVFAAAWTGFIEAIAHKDLVNEWKKYNLESYLWDKADAFAKSEMLRPDKAPNFSEEALRILYYNNFRLGMSPTAQAKHVYESVMKETIPRQFYFLQPTQLSQIQTELAQRVTGGENAIDAFSDIISQFYHALSKVDMPVSEVEIPGMVMPTKYRTDFAQLLREQIIESERVPLHPAKEGKAVQDNVINKLKAQYPKYDMEKAFDEAQAKLPPKYHTAFAEALQRRLKLSEAVPLHPSEIGRDAERVAEEVSDIQEKRISKAEAMLPSQFTREEQRGLAKISKRLEPLTVPAKEKLSLRNMFQKPEDKTSFQEYIEKIKAIGKETIPVPGAPVQKIPEEPEHIKLRARANILQKQLEQMGYDQDFFNTVIKEGKSFSFHKPNAMTNDEVKGAINRMLTYLKGSTTSRKLTRKEQKQVMRDKALRAKIFQKLPEKPSADLYNQIKEQFKDYKPETAHIFDYIRGVRHVFRKDKLLHNYGFKPLHDHAMVMEHFKVDNIRPARKVSKDIGVNQKDRRFVTNYRHLKWLKMVNPEKYGPVSLPFLSEKQAKWDSFLTGEYERFAKIFKPQNLLPFDVYSPILFDDTADDPEMEILGTFYPEGVPKNIEAFFMKKRENKDIKDKIHEDSLVLLERYIRSGAKEYFLKDDVRRIRQDLLSDKRISESMRKLLQSYTERVLGYPSVIDEFVAQTLAMGINFMGKTVGYKTEYNAEDLNHMAHTLINLTYMSTMGLRPMPVLKNLTQSLNTVCELGPTWTMSGMVDFLFKGWKEADEAGVLMEYAPELYREYEEENSFDRLRDVMLIGFQTADKINRSVAYYAGLNKFDAFSKIFKNPQKLKKWLLSHHLDETKRIEVMDAVNKNDMARARHLFAEEIVAKTQYLYNKYDSPLITRTALGKMYFQFASWPENYFELLVDWYRNKNYAAFLRAAIAAISLGCIAKQADKKWLKKFIYSMSPGAPLPLTQWKLHRYAIPPSTGPLENLLYIVGDLHALMNMQNEPEKFKKQIGKDVKLLMLSTMNWTPGGMLARDIYKWSTVPFTQTGESPRQTSSRQTSPRSVTSRL